MVNFAQLNINMHHLQSFYHHPFTTEFRSKSYSNTSIVSYFSDFKEGAAMRIVSKFSGVSWPKNLGTFGPGNHEMSRAWRDMLRLRNDGIENNGLIWP